jgi:hypothetical protein
MTKGLVWKDKDGPDDFLKYFMSITAERKQSHMGRIGVRLLFKHVKSEEDTAHRSCQFLRSWDVGKCALTTMR